MDREQLDLAVEFLRDVGDYAEDNTVDKALDNGAPLGKLVAYVLEPDSVEQTRRLPTPRPCRNGKSWSVSWSRG